MTWTEIEQIFANQPTWRDIGVSAWPKQAPAWLSVKPEPEKLSIPEIKNTVFNGDTTIILWADGTKTVVHLEEEKPYDKFSAFTAAVCKKLFGGTDRVMRTMEETDKALQAKKRAEAAAEKKKENLHANEEAKKVAEKRRIQRDEHEKQELIRKMLLEAEAKKEVDKILHDKQQ